MRISRHGQRFWAVRDRADKLVCVTVYKKGAQEVVQRLSRPRPTKPRHKCSLPESKASEPMPAATLASPSRKEK